MMLLKIVCFLKLLFGVLHAGGPEWFNLRQLDYDVKMERANVESFNHSYFKYFKCEFAPYKRIERAIKLSCDLILDLDMRVWVEFKLYKFLSNEYRDFPLSCAVNLCTECERNSFGCKDMLKRASNITLCPLKKGVYYMSNALPDFSKFPPYIPRGRYMAAIKLFNNDDFLLELHAFTEVKDKPLKWINK